MQRRTLRRSNRRSGLAGAWVVAAMLALAGAAAMAIDLGQLVIAAQRCQDVADGAALAAATQLPYEASARTAALRVASSNNSDATGWPTECSSADVTFHPPGTVLGETTLGPYAHAMNVTVHAPVEFSFARLLGLNGTTAHRSAAVVRAPVEGIPICTMWIAHNTPLNYGQQINMLMADGPHYSEIPGSFGFLQEPPGCTADWFKLLQAYGLTAQDLETSFVMVNSTVFAKTGVNVGNFKRALVDDQGKSRMERGTTGKWASDTFTNYHPDNPRIMLVPLVTYIGDTGSNAAFNIENFGAFWLEGINQGQKEIWGRFIEFDMPGGDPNSQLQSNTGVFTTSLMQ